MREGRGLYTLDNQADILDCVGLCWVGVCCRMRKVRCQGIDVPGLSNMAAKLGGNPLVENTRGERVLECPFLEMDGLNIFP
jgi:hypothetical protein